MLALVTFLLATATAPASAYDECYFFGPPNIYIPCAIYYPYQDVKTIIRDVLSHVSF